MPGDNSLISTEEHELKYLLRKWKKMQSNDNQKVLIKKIKDFKSIKKYEPHERKDFYKYVTDKKVLSLLK
ncbi:MAG: hypothetical protein KAT05_02115 [Spirochaetes bacterium]|nr:hypothetical protein [Spirochaetota bacterium]